MFSLYLRPPPDFLYICSRTVFVCVSHRNLSDTDDEAKGFVARVRRVELLSQHTLAYVSIRPQNTSAFVSIRQAKESAARVRRVELLSCAFECALILLYMCPHTTIYVSS